MKKVEGMAHLMSSRYLCVCSCLIATAFLGCTNPGTVKIGTESPASHHDSLVEMVFSAVDAGDISAVSALLDSEADAVHVRNSIGDTPLHNAAALGRDKVADLLLARGADLNARDCRGQTPLHKASGVGKESTVGLLLAHGAEVDARDIHGETPLFEALTKANYGSAKLLVLHGADVNARDNSRACLLDWMARLGKAQAVSFLIDARANVNCLTGDGETPLHLAKIGSHPEISKLLARHGAHE